MKPSLGRILLVPFVGGKLWPAIVVDVARDGVTVDCLAFSVGAALPVLGLGPGVGQVPDVKGKDGGWLWPPRTETGDAFRAMGILPPGSVDQADGGGG